MKKTIVAIFAFGGAVMLIASSAQAQNLFVGDNGSGNIYEFTPDGMQSTFASGLGDPQGLAFDSAGDLFEADGESGYIYEFTPDGEQSTFAFGLSDPQGLAFDSAGNLFVADGYSGNIYEFTPDGARSTFASDVGFPVTLAFNSAGILFEVDGDGGNIYEFTTNGEQSPFATDLENPAGLAFNSAGILFEEEEDGDSRNIDEFTTDGVESTFAPGVSYPATLAFNSAGILFETDGDGGNIYEYTTNGVQSIFASGLDVPQGLAFQVIQFTYTTNTDNTLTITGYTGPADALTIPSSINGLVVTDIGTNAFFENFSLSSVTIPGSVTNIEADAFSGCFDLTIVIFQGNAPSADPTAFSDDSATVYYVPGTSGWGDTYDGLWTTAEAGSAQFQYMINAGGTSVTITNYTGTSAVVTIPSTNTTGLPVTAIGQNAFQGNSYMSIVMVSGSVTNIEEGAFNDCPSLTSVTLDTNVTIIADEAFQNCGSLATVVIGTNVTSIGEEAFYEDGSLTSVTIPASVTNIGAQAFDYCSTLTSITVNASNTAYSSVAGVLFDINQDTLIQYPGGGTGSYTVLNSVTTIGDYAFADASLTSVTIGTNVNSIGNFAFYQDNNLTSAMIGKNVTIIESYAFYLDSSLPKVTIPASVTSIGVLAFDDCSSLTNITVCTGNTEYSSVAGVLFDINQDTLIQYPDGAFGPYTIPNTVTSIGDYAFAFASVNSVTIPPSVTSIGYESFYSCQNLVSFIIPNSVTSIEGDAFSSCTSLTNITIGTNVTSIGASAFDSCSDLTSVAIPASVTSIGEEAFGNCSSLTSITVSTNNSAYSSAAGVLFDKGQLTLVEYPGGISGPYVIPGSVTSIGEEAFYRCQNLSGITIGTNVTSIGEEAFEYCDGLTSLTIPGSVTNIGMEAFIYCNNLTTVTIGNGALNIGVDAFFNCQNLTSVTIPASVTNIGSYAFAFSYDLTTVFFGGNAPAAGPNVFAGDSGVLLFYLEGTSGWSSEFPGVQSVQFSAPAPTGNLLEPNIGSIILADNDDDSTSELHLPFSVNIYGNLYSNFWINNNGNITFTDPLETFTAFPFPNHTNVVIIAPFFADVDTTGAGSGFVYYNTFADHVAITWDSVGYYDANTDKLNTFQLVIYAPITNGNVLGFSYGTMQWTTGDGSGGEEGFGGSPAIAGFDSGNGTNAVMFFTGNSATSLADLADQTFFYLSGNGSLTSNPNATLINFDPLNATTGAVGGATFSNYLAQYGVSVTNNNPGTTVVVENQTNVAGGAFVIASSPSNVLTQIGSSGPMSFTVGFSNLLTQFGFTRPELLASSNVAVTHPAWLVQAFDSLGNLLAAINAPQIYIPSGATTNVPAQTYFLNGAGIASVEFSSEGSGFTTVNGMLLDNFVLTAGTSNNLPPSVVITSPANGQVFTSADVAISVETASGGGTVTNVAFYYGATLIGNMSNPSSTFSITSALPNGTYELTAVAFNSSGLISTSAPVSITVASGCAIETLPMSQTVAAGNQATFSITTTCAGVAYQWQHNGTNIPGANLSFYTVNNSTSSAAGNYTVTLSGPLTTSSPPAVLTVLSPPAIGPITEMIANGTITLSVTVSDGTNFFTQWLHNGTGIAGATNNYPAGTATTSYSFPAQSFNSGSYEVVVANGVTSSNSLPFTVKLGPTTVTSNNVTFASSLAINPLNGAVAGITRSASSGPSFIAGKPAGGFLWYNWTPNVSGVIYLTTLGSSFDTLLGVYTGSYPGNLTKVAADDDSGGFFTSLLSFNFQSGTTYQIVVAGYKGATGNVVLGLSPGTNAGLPGPGSGFLITSQPAPVITQEPSNQIVNAGATVTLSVVASNAASYQWYFANVPVASASGGTMNPLIIPAFSTNAVGNYFVQVSNAVGIAQSAVATVQIQNANQTSGSQTNLALDKFGDSSDLTGANAPDHFRPEDGGGDTGGFTLSQAFSTVGATKEEGEPNHAGQPGGASYWYTYSSFSPGKLRFDTTNSAFNTILAVYVNGNPNAAASFGSLISVGSNFTTNFTLQGQPSVTISNAFPYPKYYIAIDGYQGASGAAFLNVFTTPNTNAVPVTNNPPVVAITSPANNFLTTSSNITVKGTVKGIATVNAVQVAINTNAFGLATLTLGSKIFNWSTNVTLVPGANVVTVQSVTAEGTNTDIVSDPVICTIFYDATTPSASIKAPLTLETNGSGKITGEANHASLEIGKIYKITATPTGNWVFDYWNSGTNTNSLSLISDSATFSFDMVTNLVLQANFVTNPFTAIAGVYNGLFSPPSGVTEESSGFLTVTLPATSHGAYSAKLLVDGGTYAFSGAFDLAGDAEETVARPGKTSLSVNLQLDLPATNDLMGGSVSEIATNGWTSEIVADRVIFNAKTHPATNYAGKYTLLIPPGGATNEPGGYGYATLANTLAGLVTVSGSLADKTAISQSVAVSKDGNIPLYVSLYTHKGSLLGWLTLTNQSPGHPAQTIVGADLAWIKTNLPKTLYAAGFTNTNLTAFGSFYTNGINFTNCTLTISNADLGGALTNTNVSLVDNKLVSTESGTLSGTIKSSTGIVTVTFRPKDASKSSVATGVVIQDTNNTTTNAAGWFLGPTQSGFFLLQQNP